MTADLEGRVVTIPIPSLSNVIDATERTTAADPASTRRAGSKELPYLAGVDTLGHVPHLLEQPHRNAVAGQIADPAHLSRHVLRSD
jgi:hypothetical protein